MRLKSVIAPALLIVLSAAVLVQLPAAIAQRANGTDFIDPIIDVRRILLDDFVRSPDEQQMRTEALQAMVASVEDPYTIYVPPSAERDFEKDISGTYVGIGAEVNIIDDRLTIITPMEDSPALEAGVRAGDKVLAINGESTEDRSVDECIDLLLGRPGTTVTIRVRHTDGEEATLEIVRRQIVTKTVRGLRRRGETWDYCIDENLQLFYVRITQFNQTTGQELRDVLDQLKGEGLNGLVLDLRDDPGGALQSATDVADLFLDSGTIVTVKGRKADDETSFYAKPEGTLPNFPMIVLVNGRSASASEIVSGALQDRGRAKVLGTRTYGKGSVQHVRQLPFGNGTIKYTAAQYYLPSGRNLNRMEDSLVWGVDPDPGMVVTMNDDLYLQMLTARREFEIIEQPDDDMALCADPQWIRDNFLDEQLARALEAMQVRIRDDDWPQYGDDDPGVVEFREELRRLSARRAAYLDQLDAIDNRMHEIQSMSQSVGDAPLLPEDVDLTGGTITLRDKHGNPIGQFVIEGGDVELALQTLRLKTQPIDDNG